nr:hypothetical protein GCM10020093_031030 [Planobispora longispora]
MAERATGTAGAAGRALMADRPDMVRNVVLVGHSGAGKTTLVETLLAATKTIQRSGRIEDGTTVSDFDEVEIRQQRSVNLTVAPIVHNDIKINLLDTPATPTSSATCARACARPTPRCSSSRRPRAWTA